MTMRVKKITGLAGSLPGSSLVRKSRNLEWNGRKTVTKCTYIIQLQRNNSCIYTTKLHHVYISNVKQCGSPLLVAKSRSKVMCQLPLAHLLHPARKSRDLDKIRHNKLNINYILQVKKHLKTIMDANMLNNSQKSIDLLLWALPSIDHSIQSHLTHYPLILT